MFKIMKTSCTCFLSDIDGLLDELVKRLLEEKQTEKRLEKEREERRESSKLLYELERILKRQDPDCKVTGEDCSHWDQVREISIQYSIIKFIQWRIQVGGGPTLGPIFYRPQPEGWGKVLFSVHTSMGASPSQVQVGGY